jgi:hypothetical protein
LGIGLSNFNQYWWGRFIAGGTGNTSRWSTGFIFSAEIMKNAHVEVDNAKGSTLGSIYNYSYDDNFCPSNSVMV